MSSKSFEQSLVIPANHSVHRCELDGAMPFCEIRPDEGNMEPATVLEIPFALAYFLRTHWCGSAKMEALIATNATRRVQQAIKDALGLTTK